MTKSLTVEFIGGPVDGSLVNRELAKKFVLKSETTGTEHEYVLVIVGSKKKSRRFFYFYAPFWKAMGGK